MKLPRKTSSSPEKTRLILVSSTVLALLGLLLLIVIDTIDYNSLKNGQERIGFIVTIKEYFRFLFESRIGFWTAVTGIFTLFGIQVSLLWQYFSHKIDLERDRQGLISGIKHEILNNFNIIFSYPNTNKAELFFYNQLKRNYRFVLNYKTLNALISLYKLAEKYNEFLNDKQSKERAGICLSMFGFVNKYIDGVISAEDDKNLSVIKKEIETENESTNELLFLKETYLSKKESLFPKLEEFVENVFE